MKYLFGLTLILISLNCNSSHGQKQVAPGTFYEQYEQFKEASIVNRRFKHADIVPLIEGLKAPFETHVVGQSVEGRDIYLVKLGNGPTKVLLWSQMHGNEPTATMAIMDIFNFFSQKGDFENLKSKLLDRLTIYFIPMLNPDGAEKFQRRNALGVDLNRDALRLETPEGQILKKVRDEIDADWGFNLHDQNRYYSAGLPVSKIASVSFLAPAYNFEKEVNEKREDAMKLIVSMNKVLQSYMPKQVGRYSDAFEPRAFGDNIQKWGTRTILIESGGLQNDPEKQELRKLHFVMLLHAMESIAINAFQRESISAYKKIPYNKSNGFKDLLIKGAQIDNDTSSFIMDIGYKRNEISINNYQDFYYKSYIDDIGDLSVYKAYKEVDASGYTVVPGKVFERSFTGVEDLQDLNILKMIKDGYTSFFVDYLPQSHAVSRWPIQLHLSGRRVDNSIVYGGNPAFFLQKNGQNRYLIVNGFLWDLEKEEAQMKKALAR